jgi:uncharacterized protein (TIGR00251 family)
MSLPCYRWDKDRLILNVRVQPRAGKDEIAGVQQQRLKIRITAPPVDGKANAHLIGFIADVFEVRKSQVTLLSGQSSRDKRLCIRSPSRLLPFIHRNRDL